MYIGSKRGKEPLLWKVINSSSPSPAPYFKPGAGSVVARQDQQAAAQMHTTGDNCSPDLAGCGDGSNPSMAEDAALPHAWSITSGLMGLEGSGRIKVALHRV